MNDFSEKIIQILNHGALNLALGLGMMWGKEQALALLAQAGFERVDVLEIPNDPFNLHFLSINLPQKRLE